MFWVDRVGQHDRHIFLNCFGRAIAQIGDELVEALVSLGDFLLTSRTLFVVLSARRFEIVSPPFFVSDVLLLSRIPLHFLLSTLDAPRSQRFRMLPLGIFDRLLMLLLTEESCESSQGWRTAQDWLSRIGHFSGHGNRQRAQVVDIVAHPMNGENSSWNVSVRIAGASKCAYLGNSDPLIERPS
jgi:hypothetical protein